MRAMSSDPSNRKRRWFQFSLRSLLIVVTIFCVFGGWLGNEYRIVCERNALVHRILTNGQRWGVVVVPDTNDFSVGTIRARAASVDREFFFGFGLVPDDAFLFAANKSNAPKAIASTLRKWLGDSDQRVRVICIPADADAGDAAAAAELFPEARIWHTSEAEIALIQSGRGRGTSVPGRPLPLTPADREHLARYYNTLAANRPNPPATPLPDRK
jgi:hypothetical protein